MNVESLWIQLPLVQAGGTFRLPSRLLSDPSPRASALPIAAESSLVPRSLPSVGGRNTKEDRDRHVELCVHGDTCRLRDKVQPNFRKSLAAFLWWVWVLKRCPDRQWSSSSSVLRERACRISTKSSKWPAVIAARRRSRSTAWPSTGCSCEKCSTNTKHGHGRSPCMDTVTQSKTSSLIRDTSSNKMKS